MTANAAPPAPGSGLALFVLGGIALFGNGLKAIVTSTVLVSEGRFADFLGIAVERVSLLMETIVAGMVIALALYPLVIQRVSARAVAMIACVSAAVSFAGFAAVVISHPSLAQRELAAYACLTIGAAALAWLAPSAQALVTKWPAAAGRKTLNTVWTSATPAGFLVAPQLAKWLLPALGLGGYFAGFALLPLLTLALVVASVAWLLARSEEPTQVTLPRDLLAAFLAAVIAFEAWSTLGSLAGYAKALTVAALGALVATLVWLALRVVRMPLTGTPAATWWLVAALFVLEMPTTGFFEAAYLFQNGWPTAFVADRATLSAASQVLGTFVAGLLIHHAPEMESSLRLPSSLLALVAIAGYAAYPSVTEPAYYLATAALAGLGIGALTLLLCLAIVHDAAHAPVLAALPSMAIMIGTEVGLELLQGVFAAVRGIGMGANEAFRALFVAQIAFAAGVPMLLAAARRHG